MAHKARTDASVYLPRKALLERPPFAALLGLVASEWVSVEVGLAFLYATLLGKYLPHSQRKGPPVHPIGMQIFEAIESIHKKTQLLKQLAATLTLKKSLIDELNNDLIPQIHKAAKQRSRLVHGYWGLNDEKYPHAVLLIENPGSFMVYEESDFNEVIDLIIATDKAVSKFEAEVLKHLKRQKRPSLIQ